MDKNLPLIEIHTAIWRCIATPSHTVSASNSKLQNALEFRNALIRLSKSAVKPFCDAVAIDQQNKNVSDKFDASWESLNPPKAATRKDPKRYLK